MPSPSRLRPALDRRKYRALVWAGKVQLTARKPPGSSTTPAGAVGSSPRSRAPTPQVSETDILARGGRPLASARARPSRLARLRGACWISWGHQHRKSRAIQRDYARGLVGRNGCRSDAEPLAYNWIVPTSWDTLATLSRRRNPP